MFANSLMLQSVPIEDVLSLTGRLTESFIIIKLRYHFSSIRT